MNDLGFVPVMAITVICYLVGLAVKAMPVNDKWIPVIVGSCGAALGAIALYIMPDFPATELLTAVAVGIVSGLASTGINQVYKQLRKENVK